MFDSSIPATEVSKITAESYTNVDSVGGQTSARRKPYRNDTRKPSNRATNKRICKYKAITKEEN
jgi:hypothetical protein